jgi:hypothetical protein
MRPPRRGGLLDFMRFECMDAVAFWHDIKFSLRHLKDFSRPAVVCPPDMHHLWSSLVAPLPCLAR